MINAGKKRVGHIHCIYIYLIITQSLIIIILRHSLTQYSNLLMLVYIVKRITSVKAPARYGVCKLYVIDVHVV